MNNDNHQDELTTRTLDQILSDVDDRKSLNRYLERASMSTTYHSFIDYFRSLQKTMALSDSQLQKESGIDRTYCYHILNGSKTPGRDKIIRLCLAAGLDETESRRALEAGNVPVLYAKSRRDAIIRFALQAHLSVMETNLLLDEYQVEPLE